MDVADTDMLNRLTHPQLALTREDTCFTNSFIVDEIALRLSLISAKFLVSLSAYKEKKEETDEEKFV
jgi:hypothetical protein